MLALLLVLALLCLIALLALVREQHSVRPMVRASIGRSWMTGRDCELFIGWQHSGGAGYGSYKRSIELTWDWLPTLYWDRCTDLSRRWTGRTRTFAGWSWYKRLDVRGGSRPIMLWSF